MAIKRGVSFYSYQQAQYLGQMTTADMMRELRENLGCDGVEIINEASVPGYPFPSQDFLADWHNNLARYELTPVCLDGFLDTMRFRDHVMNEREAAELVKLDLQLAHDMGFKHIRTMTALPLESIQWALDTAVKLDVKIAWEIHSPIPIKPDPTIFGKYRRNGESPGTAVQETVEFIEKLGTRHVGFVPDFGIFCRGPFLDGILGLIRKMEDRDMAANIEAAMKEVPLAELGAELEKRWPGRLNPAQQRAFAWSPVAAPEDLVPILPYVFSFHGKCHDMVEIPGQPGHYEEPALIYDEVIRVLKDNNWDGYICTEFEGQKPYQDMAPEFLVDEVDQVRRHHEMLRRLIGE